MPYVRELELAVAATALWRRWPSQERGAADALLAEIRRLASAPPGDWLDVPLRAPAEGYAE